MSMFVISCSLSRGKSDVNIRGVLLACFLLALPAVVNAQWLELCTPGIPRLADGRPDLMAPAPRTADGTPDLSGIWTKDAADLD
jgi:hypothetical protein